MIKLGQIQSISGAPSTICWGGLIERIEVQIGDGDINYIPLSVGVDLRGESSPTISFYGITGELSLYTYPLSLLNTPVRILIQNCSDVETTIHINNGDVRAHVLHTNAEEIILGSQNVCEITVTTICELEQESDSNVNGFQRNFGELIKSRTTFMNITMYGIQL